MPTENKIPVTCGAHYKFMGWTCMRPPHKYGTHSRVPLEEDLEQIEQREAYNGHAEQD